VTVQKLVRKECRYSLHYRPGVADSRTAPDTKIKCGEDPFGGNFFYRCRVRIRMPEGITFVQFESSPPNISGV